jgi:hypothetical protein
MLNGNEASEVRREYESTTDKDYEEVARMFLAGSWDCEIHSNPKFYQIDWTATRNGKVVSYIEYKHRRKYSWQKLEELGGYNLSLHKFMNMGVTTMMTLKPCFLVVDLKHDSSDAREYWYAKIHNGQMKEVIGYEFGFWGRNDRGDSQDMEPSVTIPMSEFQRV